VEACSRALRPSECMEPHPSGSTRKVGRDPSTLGKLQDVEMGSSFPQCRRPGALPGAARCR